MLKSVLAEIEKYETIHNIRYTIIDDGSDFYLDDENFYQFEHLGKPGFWKLFDYAFKHCKENPADLYVFMPSDVSNIDFGRLINYSKVYSHKRNNSSIQEPYCYNLIRDDRECCWNLQKMMEYDLESYQSYFCDCGFFCNDLMLRALNYTVHSVNPSKFLFNEFISSGVGQQLTMRLNHLNIKTFHPKKSLVEHGVHDSLMHPILRKKQPLKSK